jgi:DNA-binding MarR family transcriptional regulator
MGIIDLVRTMSQEPLQNLSAEARQALRTYWEAVSLAEPLLISLWRSSGLTLTQMRILHALARQTTSAGDLARTVGVKASSLTRLLDRLEERGLVVRQVDPDDRRRLSVSITTAGRDFLNRAPTAPANASAFVAGVRELSEAEALAFTEALRRFIDGVRAAREREETKSTLREESYTEV